MGTFMTVAAAEGGAILPLGVRELADVKKDGTRRQLIGALGAASTPSVLFGGITGLIGLGVAAARMLLGVGRRIISQDVAEAAGAYGLPALTESVIFALRPKGQAPAEEVAPAAQAGGIEIEVSDGGEVAGTKTVEPSAVGGGVSGQVK